MLLRDIKKELNKCQDLLYSWVRGDNIVNMAVL